MTRPPIHIHTPARRFELHRDADATGVSGTGVVASGLCWGDGRACLRWHTALRSTTAYESMADVEAIHGHNGSTRIVWVDYEGDYTWSCVMCGGGTTRDWCADCGARGTAALVPLWWADDAERQRHLRWNTGVLAAEAAVGQCATIDEALARLAELRVIHETADRGHRKRRDQYRRRVSETDARPVVWEAAPLTSEAQASTGVET